MVIDLFLRNVFLVFIPGVFDFTQILLSLIIFMALAYAHEKKQVVFDAIYNIFPQTLKWVFSLISSIFVLAIGIIIGRSLVQFAIVNLDQAQTLTLRIPLAPITLLGAVGILLFCFSVVGDLIFIIKDRGVLRYDSN